MRSYSVFNFSKTGSPSDSRPRTSYPQVTIVTRIGFEIFTGGWTERFIPLLEFVAISAL